MWKREGNELVIHIPLKGKRFNPYMGDDQPDVEFDSVAGFIDEFRCGLVHMIDMDYKGKDDQWTDIFVEWPGSKEDFRTWCEANDIMIIE